MNLGSIRTMAQQIVQVDLDMALSSNAPSAATTAEWNAVINQALRFIGKRCLLMNHKVTLTLVASQLAYNLRDTSTPVVSQEVILPFQVVINQSPLPDRYNRDYGFWGVKELDRYYPKWRTDGAGAPQLACWLGQNGGNDLIVYPAPNSTVVGNGNNFVSGLVMPAALSNDSDIPQLPTEVHESVAALAAVLAAIPGATEAEAWQRLEELGKFYEPVDKVRQINLQVLRHYSGSINLYDLFTEADSGANTQPTQTNGS